MLLFFDSIHDATDQVIGRLIVVAGLHERIDRRVFGKECAGFSRCIQKHSSLFGGNAGPAARINPVGKEQFLEVI